MFNMGSEDREVLEAFLKEKESSLKVRYGEPYDIFAGSDKVVGAYGNFTLHQPT